MNGVWKSEKARKRREGDEFRKSKWSSNFHGRRTVSRISCLMFNLIVALMDRQGRENTGGISVVHGCSTFFLSFHVTADEYSREPRRSSIQLLNQGEETNFRRGSSRTVAHLPSPPLPRITLLLRLRNIFFTARGEGEWEGEGDIKREMVS